METKLVMKLSSLGRAARSQARIKIRQPLLKVIADIPPGERPSLLKLKSQLLEELNVKDLEFADGLDRFPKTQYSVTSDSGYTVAIPIEITPELEAEGLAREIVHRIQMMRRSAGFDITDHIITHYQSDAKANQVISLFSDYIKQETLSDQLVKGDIGTLKFSQSYQLGQCQISLGVTRLR
jgi:isoleucyl-tRNA synthetase